MRSTSAGFERRPCAPKEEEVDGLELGEPDPLGLTSLLIA
jgi:hypothetical protein